MHVPKDYLLMHDGTYVCAWQWCQMSYGGAKLCMWVGLFQLLLLLSLFTLACAFRIWHHIVAETRHCGHIRIYSYMIGIIYNYFPFFYILLCFAGCSTWHLPWGGTEEALLCTLWHPYHYSCTSHRRTDYLNASTPRSGWRHWRHNPSGSVHWW